MGKGKKPKQPIIIAQLSRREFGVFEELPDLRECRLRDHGTPRDFRFPDRDEFAPPRYANIFLEQLISGLADGTVKPTIMHGYRTEGYLIPVGKVYELHITADKKSPHLYVMLVDGEFREDLVGKASVTGSILKEIDKKGERFCLEAKVVKTLSGAKFSAGGL